MKKLHHYPHQNLHLKDYHLYHFRDHQNHLPLLHHHMLLFNHNHYHFLEKFLVTRYQSHPLLHCFLYF